MYSSLDWRKMISLGTFTTKEMQKKDAVSGEETKPPQQKVSKKKTRKDKKILIGALVDSG